MDRLDDNLNNYEKALNRIESELSQEALPHTELASRKIELKKIGENLTELQGNRSNTIEKRSEKAAANALNPDLGLGASESALEKIKELEGRVAASEELIKQKEEKSTWASGLGQWISGWFSTPSVPPGDASASALEEDWENVTRAEAIAEAILEAALRQGKNSEILVLDKQSLTSLPDDFGRWEETKRFKQLMLNQNALSKLPDSMGEMTELNTLELGSNKLETFPPSMANLKKLKVLYINNNPMKELPGCIYEMKSLERLDIANTKITNINIAAFPNLLILYINENGNSELLENIQGALANNKSLKFKIMFRS